MQVEIGMSSPGDTDALMSLFRWLNRDQELRHSARVSLARSGDAADMGAADVINMVFTQGISLLNLAIAYVSWRESRTHSPSITVRTENAVVTLTGTSREGTEKALLSLLGDIRETEVRADGTPDTASAPGTEHR